MRAPRLGGSGGAGRRRVAGVLLALALTVVPWPGPAAAAGGEPLRLEVLSSRPDVVSDGDALARVAVPGDVPGDAVVVRLDGRDVTSVFRAVPGGGALVGVVSGMAPGGHVLSAAVAGAGRRGASVVLRNHPRSGPVFAGPHEEPFVCGTQGFRTVAGDLLGAPTGPQCTVDTRVDHVYRTTTGALRRLPDPASRPDDLAWTTTTTGVTVAYIVRVETGVINRAIYEFAMLHDPTTPDPDPLRPSAGWNGRLIYTFGGGCPGGWFQQGSSTGGVSDDVMLRRGYAVASASLNVFGNNCNDLLAAETMAMVREHVVEEVGPPLHTIGWGCSGGSYQSHQIADNYPGLLDGIVVACSFPEVGFATLHTITDAWLLHNYFTEVAPGSFTPEQQRAVTGFAKVGTAGNLAGGARRIDPRVYCPASLPAELRYHPVDNPTGARCDVYDHTVNVYGRDPATGFARRPLDNVGIQYGLAALRAGQISVDQFLDLNERVGGFDADANVVAARTVADPAATVAAYRSGRLLNGGGGLATTPIIDYRDYTDDLPNGDIHLRFHSFSTRERLAAANGDAGNQVMLVDNGDTGGFSTRNPVVADALSKMDSWLTAIGGDSRPGSARGRMMRNKPADLVDACWTPGSDPQRIAEPQVHGVNTTRCNTLYPSWPAPREVAGAHVANDIVKCRLRPASLSEYGVPFTPSQAERLDRVFPGGVCDWSAPGVGQQPLAGTWLRF